MFSRHNLESSQTWGSVYNFYITNQFHNTFAQEGVGGVKSIVEVTVKSKDEDSCPSYVQEFDRRAVIIWPLFYSPISFGRGKGLVVSGVQKN